MSASSLPGFRDFYPEDLARRAWLFERWREVARRFGYSEYDGPPLEPLELYTRKSGDEIVGQLYSFADRGGRAVSLRPEMTPTVARMVTERANTLRKPVRWFSIPQLFRYERQQKGRLREHFQLNVDIFGEADVAADAELLAVACEIMRACGLGPGDVRARVSDRRLLSVLLRAVGVGEAAHGAAFSAIDKLGREPRAELVRRMETAGVDAAAAGRALDLTGVSDLADLPRELAADPDVAAGVERFRRYRALLEAHGVWDFVELDLSIVRGLAYYTGTVFELFDTRGEFRAICGGGRYDTLLSALGGVDLPALGFGMGDVVLGELLKARGLGTSDPSRIDVWVVPEPGVSPNDVVRCAAALRRLGLSASHVLSEARLGTQKSREQLGAASKAGAERALLVRDLGGGTLRPLLRGPLSEAPLKQWSVDVKALLESANAADYRRRMSTVMATIDDGLLWLLQEKGRGEAARGATDRP